MTSTASECVSLRQAEPADEDFLRGIFLASRPELSLIDGDPTLLASILDLQLRAQRHHYQAGYQAVRECVIEVDDVPVGRLVVGSDDDAVVVLDVAIAPSHRGGGIGTAVLSRVIDDASGHRTVRLTVARHNQAQRLYQRLGFDVVGSSDTDLLMELDLTRQEDAT